MNFVCEKATGPDRKCDFRMGAIILQQQLDAEQVKKLLETGKTDLLKKFVSKRTGRKFEAFLKLDSGKVGFEFAPRKSKFPAKDAKSKEPPKKIDFTGQEPIGKCPKCGGNVFESEKDFLCERTQADTKKCKFKTGKVILQQPVERDQVKKLLAEGRTDLLTKFVSSKTGRPFQAFLVLDENSKVTFDFPPRDEQT
jgi:DNA topoisomerase-3